MLVLTRRTGESIRAGRLVVRVLEITPNRVRLGFVAPAEVNIVRLELLSADETFKAAWGRGRWSPAQRAAIMAAIGCGAREGVAS